MLCFVFVVSEVFELPDGTVAVAARMPRSLLRARAGDALELRPPGGAPPIRTRVASVPTFEPHRREGPSSLCLPPGLRAADVPAGTEVWLVEEGAPA